MAHFRIVNTVSGMDLGIYQGQTAEDALDDMARIMGYADHADACSVAPVDDGELRVTRVDDDAAETNSLTPGLRVVRHDDELGLDVGTAYECFGADDLGRILIGESQGEDSQRGAYDWWPLTIDGHLIGELRDDANGLTIHVTPETWMAGVGLLVPADDGEG
jgi:hypothetical protein